MGARDISSPGRADIASPVHAADISCPLRAGRRGPVSSPVVG
jgi:hypothetical protein